MTNDPVNPSGHAATPDRRISLIIVLTLGWMVYLTQLATIDTARFTVEGVDCIVHRGVFHGGISCDWTPASPTTTEPPRG